MFKKKQKKQTQVKRDVQTDDMTLVHDDLDTPCMVD